MNEITVINGITILIAVGAFMLSLYNTWKQHHVRGPEFNVAEARITDRTTDTRVVMILIQNIGDRMGYVRWDDIKFKVGERLFKPKVPTGYRGIIQADTQEERTFHFFAGEHENLVGGFFIAKGVYSSHKGKGMIPDTWKTPLTGILKPIKIEERRTEDEF